MLILRDIDTLRSARGIGEWDGLAGLVVEISTFTLAQTAEI